MRWWVLACFALLLLAGCHWGPHGPDGCVPPVSATEAADGALAQDGAGEDRFVVRVRDAATDSAIPGARVIIHYNRDYVDPHDGSGAGPTPTVVAVALRTDSDGTAAALLPAGRFRMATAWGPLYTEEATNLYWPEDDGPADLALVPSRVNATASGSFAAGPLGTPKPYLSGETQEHAMDFGPQLPPTTLFRRVVEARAELRWPVQETLDAELDLTATLDDESLDLGRDTSTEGQTHVLRASLDASQVRAAEAGVLAFQVHFPPQSVLMAELPYSLWLDMELEGRSLEKQRCGVLFGDSSVIRFGSGWTGESVPVETPQEEPRETSDRDEEAVASLPAVGVAGTLMLAATIRRRLIFSRP